tara:strand:+ start:22 stop:405 length:384 start_codon:yes stop_codon:yes gene_type:complete
MFAEDRKKFINYNIVDNRHQSPPYEWSQGIFQRWKPQSGPFIQGNNWYGGEPCVNNPTGRAFYANPCGYWFETNNQFNPIKTEQLFKEPSNGNMFPLGYTSENQIMSPPQDKIVFGYARIGQTFRSR